MGSQNEMMIQTMDSIDGTTPHNKGAEVEGGVASRETPQLPREFWEVPPSLGGKSSDGQSEQSSQHSNQMGVSQESG